MEEGQALAGHQGSNKPPGAANTSQENDSLQPEASKEEEDLLERHNRKINDQAKGKEKEVPSFKDALISLGTTSAHAEMVPDLLEYDEGIIGMENVDVDGIPSITITDEDKVRIWKPWSTSIIIRVIGRSLGHTYLIHKLETMWKPLENMMCMDLGDHFWLVRFNSPSDMTKVLNEGPWFIGPHYVAIRKWEPEFDTSSAKVSTSVVWVRLPGLPVEFYDKEMLLKIGAKVGKLLKIDLRTETNEKNCNPSPPEPLMAPPTVDAKFGEWMLVTNKSKARRRNNLQTKEEAKSDASGIPRRWNRKDRNSSNLEGAKMQFATGTSSSSQIPTKPTLVNSVPLVPISPTLTPSKSLLPNPCNVPISQPLTPPILPQLDGSSLPNAPESSAAPSASSIPVIAPISKPASLFSPKNTMLSLSQENP
ncbi:hypothetical protein Vadar_030583 [Vaccinium darrowii]|uniref:Uncharacterized protein n=1 Tax=Vaccinium darrowii TaxID=229202 RepID=A0ACB7Y468_9ERIC|nr:hypothetical protein Vadar_030583 [Vaccinium darrowii]